jgi:hypothetical protein
MMLAIAGLQSPSPITVAIAGPVAFPDTITIAFRPPSKFFKL